MPKKLDKALDMGKTSAHGSLYLFIGKVMSTIVLAVGTIILGFFIKDTEYGLYTIALIPAITLQLFYDLGISAAMTKYCAQYRGTDSEGDLYRITILGLTFEIAIGLVLTLISLMAANFISYTIFSKPEAAPLIVLVSITILSNSVLAGSQSIFTGFERMKLSSLTLGFQAATQAVLLPLLVYLGFGAWGATLGYTSSSVVSGAFALILVYMTIIRKLPHSPLALNTRKTLKMLLSYGLPLAIASIFGGLLTQLTSFVMASSVDVGMIGNFRIATNFAVLLSFVSFPISTVLFPAFSKLNPQSEINVLRTVFNSSVKYTVLFLVPSTLALMVLSGSIIGTLYADKWLSAPFFLALYVINNLFSVFGSISIYGFFQGVGETKLLMMLNLLTLVLGVTLAFVLVPTFGIIGVIFAPVIAGKPSLIWMLYWMWKRYRIKIDLKSPIRILTAATISAALTFSSFSFLPVVEWIRLFVGAIIFLGTYILIIPTIGAITKDEIHNLRDIFSGLGVVSRIIKVPLWLLEKMAKNKGTSEKTSEVK
jgi:O-antigen/teichoic acid export membrane protein